MCAERVLPANSLGGQLSSPFAALFTLGRENMLRGKYDDLKLKKCCGSRQCLTALNPDDFSQYCDLIDSFLKLPHDSGEVCLRIFVNTILFCSFESNEKERGKAQMKRLFVVPCFKKSICSGAFAALLFVDDNFLRTLHRNVNASPLTLTKI